MSTPGLFGILQEIAEATDEQTAIAIATEFGGCEVLVPQKPRQNGRNKLVQLIGVDKAKLIADYIGAGSIEIPQAGFTGTTARRRYARDLLKAGMTTTEVVKATGYTSRQLRRIKGVTPPSLPLFDD